ncbi:MAG: MurR/RpiR family transcriptional regulator [Thermosipho sp. (in: Bacteria)]|nr:MurR/RpiR family transcriptional regulator [Thermosipho sp. (in: thermotogales)]
MNGVIALIKHRMSDLTKSEKKIAEIVLQSTNQIIKMTVNELATMCGVSDATVIRFIKKLDFETFQEFKFSLAKEEVENVEEEMELVLKPSDTPGDVHRKITSASLRTIESTSKITRLKLDSYIEVARAIRSSNKICIFGVGASGAVSIFLQYKLTRNGYPAVAIVDPHMQAILAANMTSKDLAIGISQSGSTKDTVDSLAVAKEHGAMTVAITDHKNSPIAKYSSIIIETFSSDNPIKNSAGRSVLAQIYAIEILTGILQTLDYERSVKFGEETAKAVIKKLY